MSLVARRRLGFGLFLVVVAAAHAWGLSLPVTIAALVVGTVFTFGHRMMGEGSRSDETKPAEEAELRDAVAGPVERVGTTLVLRIPLDEGGEQLIECSRGWGNVEGDCLEVMIHPWIAEKLGLTAGSRVGVGNRGGKFTLWPEDPGPKSVASSGPSLTP